MFELLKNANYHLKDKQYVARNFVLIITDHVDTLITDFDDNKNTRSQV